VANEPPRYVRYSCAPFVTTASEQRDAIVAVCERMDALEPAIVEAGGMVPDARWNAVGPWLKALSQFR
jgi:hypothetical protein